MHIIQNAIGKLRGCVRQVENQNPSGASQKDIVSTYHYICRIGFTIYFDINFLFVANSS